MERTTKRVTFVSMMAAVVIESSFVSYGWPAVWPLTIAVFVIAACIAWIAKELAAALVLVFAYIYPALMILVHGRFYAEYGVVWMAAILGAMAPRSAWSQWAVPRPWKAPLILWALTVSLAWPVVVLREMDFVLATLDELHMANSVSGSFPQEAATVVLNTAATLGIGILWFDWLFLTFGADVERFRRWIPGALAASWLVAVAVAGYQLFGHLQFLNTGVFASMGRATSTMGDANAFGMVAAVSGALVIAWLMSADRGRPWWLVIIAVALSWIGLWASGSRTALAAGVIILAFLAWSASSWERHSSTVSTTRLIAVVGAIVVLLALGASIRLPAIGPVERLRESLPSPTIESVSAFLKEMWNRNAYGAASMVMIRQHPLVGVGAGSFSILVPDYSSIVGSTFLIPRDNAQNWYRHQLAEFGVLGSVGWILWTVSFGWFVLVGARSARERLPLGILKGALVALAAVSLVGMPTQNTAVALTLWTMAFWVSSLGGDGERSTVQPAALGRIRWTGLVAVLCLFIGGTAYAARHDLRVARRAVRADWRYAYGFYEPEHGADGRDFRWTRQRAVIVLPAPTRWMRLTVSINHSDLSKKPVDVLVWCNDRVVLERTLRTSDPVAEFVRMPDGEDRVVLETWVSRVMRPRDVGGADPRDLGLMVQWDFVDAPSAGATTSKP
jgi:hypothetical protein